MTQIILQWCSEWQMHGNFMSKSLQDIINTPNFEISQKVNIFNIEVHEHQSFLGVFVFLYLTKHIKCITYFSHTCNNKSFQVMYHTAAHTFTAVLPVLQRIHSPIQSKSSIHCTLVLPLSSSSSFPYP